MSKVYDSPTTNLYALLADAGDQPKNKSKANASKAGQELTPKERAAAKAVQDAERKKEQDAEKAKKAAAAERRKNIEVTDDTGFTQQRHQRVKEARTAPVEAKGPKGDKPKGQGTKTFPKGPKSEGSPKNVDKFRGPKGENNKTFAGKPDGKVEGNGNAKGEGKVYNNNKGGERPPRGREFDKHSQGVNTRKPSAKKGGHGKGNWDKAVPAAEEAATNAEATETTENKEVTDAAPAVEGEVAAEAAATAKHKEGEEEEDEEDKGITLDEYQKLQEEKRKELEAKIGAPSTAQARSLSEDEQKALAKFTVVENTKAQPVKAANTSAAPKKQNKGPVILEINPKLPRVDGRDERKGPRRYDNDGPRRFENDGPRRFENDGPRRFNDNKEGARGNKPNQQNKTRTAKPQKLPRGGNFDAAFPTL